MANQTDITVSNVNQNGTVVNNAAVTLRNKMELERIRNKIKDSHDDLLKQIDQHFARLERELTQDFYNLEHSKQMSNNKVHHKTIQAGALPEKFFTVRNSILTDLFQISHIQTIYHIFVAILIVLFLNAMVDDLVRYDKINLGLATIHWNFSKLSDVAVVWLAMMTATLCVYPVFKFWAEKRVQFLPHCILVKLLDVSFILITIIYQTVFLVIPCAEVFKKDLPIACSAIVLMEQVRMVMKSHAFIRSNAPRVLSFKKDKPTTLVPDFSKYLYYLFVPTLVYRDQYPRRSHIKWKDFCYHILDVVGCIIYISFLSERFLLPCARQVDIENLKLEQAVLAIFGSMIPALLIFICGFFLLLHSWMNAFAEILRFGDRIFYMEWWNSTSFKAYYRNWNVVVYDWLYTYIYKDVIDNLIKNRGIGTMIVFIVSALFHEYILAVTFRFFYPCLFVVFGFFGTTLMFIPKRFHGRAQNVFIWTGLCIGTGLLAVLYEVEYIARTKCPQVIESDVIDFFTPRSWTCFKMAQS